MNTNCEGYLVVLRVPEYQSDNRANPKYSGVNRVPAYPSNYPQEEAALEEYFFGNTKSIESNLIPEFLVAVQLMNKLVGSPREFEVLLCCTGPESELYLSFRPDQIIGLGYDVAAISGDGWSIVSDFAMGDWSEPFLHRLNEFGLFNSRDEALNYLRMYRNRSEPDADMPFEIVYVARVILPVRK